METYCRGSVEEAPACFLAVALLTMIGCGRTGDILPISASPEPDAQRATNRQQLPRQASSPRIPERVQSRGFVSSTSCRACHREQYESWHRTFHRTMTQVASAESIVAPFDGRNLHRAEVTYSVERRGDEFWVTTPDPDREFFLVRKGEPKYMPELPIVERQVVMTTGFHHLQTYWLSSQMGNELRLFPWVYSLDERRWIPYEDSFVIPPNIGRLRVCWNNSCIACHSVDGRPNFNDAIGHFVSEVVEFGIACESCHGPGEQHIRRHELGVMPNGGVPDPIVNPRHCSPKVSTQICGQCHSSFTFDSEYFTEGPRFRAGDPLEKTHHVIGFAQRADARHPFRDSYWEDGTARIGGREYLGLVASVCYNRGDLSCLSCHSMHHSDPDQQLAEGSRGNDTCLACHQALSDRIEQHTHHPVGSSGSLCYNCHMPRTSYALFRATRSHRIDSPSVSVSVATGRPNACNLCHLDRPLSWTSKYLNEWFNIRPVELNEQQSTVAASGLWLLSGDAAQRVITAWHMGWEPAQQAADSHWQAPLLAQLLDDSYSAVRLVAFHSLKSLPQFNDLDYDFLATKDQLSQAKEDAVSRWHQGERRVADSPAFILQTPTGELNREMVNWLLEQQDRRPIILSE